MDWLTICRKIVSSIRRRKPQYPGPVSATQGWREGLTLAMFTVGRTTRFGPQVFRISSLTQNLKIPDLLNRTSCCYFLLVAASNIRQ